jgi:hypothetical protein
LRNRVFRSWSTHESKDMSYSMQMANRSCTCPVSRSSWTPLRLTGLELHRASSAHSEHGSPSKSGRTLQVAFTTKQLHISISHLVERRLGPCTGPSAATSVHAVSLLILCMEGPPHMRVRSLIRLCVDFSTLSNDDDVSRTRRLLAV